MPRSMGSGTGESIYFATDGKNPIKKARRLAREYREALEQYQEFREKTQGAANLWNYIRKLIVNTNQAARTARKHGNNQKASNRTEILGQILTGLGYSSDKHWESFTFRRWMENPFTREAVERFYDYGVPSPHPMGVSTKRTTKEVKKATKLIEAAENWYYPDETDPVEVLAEKKHAFHKYGLLLMSKRKTVERRARKLVSYLKFGDEYALFDPEAGTSKIYQNKNSEIMYPIKDKKPPYKEIDISKDEFNEWWRAFLFSEWESGDPTSVRSFQKRIHHLRYVLMGLHKSTVGTNFLYEQIAASSQGYDASLFDIRHVFNPPEKNESGIKNAISNQSNPLVGLATPNKSTYFNKNASKGHRFNPAGEIDIAYYTEILSEFFAVLPGYIKEFPHSNRPRRQKHCREVFTGYINLITNKSKVQTMINAVDSSRLDSLSESRLRHLADVLLTNPDARNKKLSKIKQDLGNELSSVSLPSVDSNGFMNVFTIGNVRAMGATMLAVPDTTLKNSAGDWISGGKRASQYTSAATFILAIAGGVLEMLDIAKQGYAKLEQAVTMVRRIQGTIQGLSALDAWFGTAFEETTAIKAVSKVGWIFSLVAALFEFAQAREEFYEGDFDAASGYALSGMSFITGSAAAAGGAEVGAIGSAIGGALGGSLLTGLWIVTAILLVLAIYLIATGEDPPLKKTLKHCFFGEMFDADGAKYWSHPENPEFRFRYSDPSTATQISPYNIDWEHTLYYEPSDILRRLQGILPKGKRLRHENLKRLKNRPGREVYILLDEGDVETNENSNETEFPILKTLDNLKENRNIDVEWQLLLRKTVSLMIEPPKEITRDELKQNSDEWLKESMYDVIVKIKRVTENVSSDVNWTRQISELNSVLTPIGYADEGSITISEVPKQKKQLGPSLDTYNIDIKIDPGSVYKKESQIDMRGYIVVRPLYLYQEMAYLQKKPVIKDLYDGYCANVLGTPTKNPPLATEPPLHLIRLADVSKTYSNSHTRIPIWEADGISLSGGGVLQDYSETSVSVGPDLTKFGFKPGSGKWASYPVDTYSTQLQGSIGDLLGFAIEDLVSSGAKLRDWFSGIVEPLYVEIMYVPKQVAERLGSLPWWKIHRELDSSMSVTREIRAIDR